MTSLERYHWLRDRGLCISCKRPLDDPAKTRCPECRERHLDTLHQYKRAKEAMGKCLWCKNDPLPGKAMCQACIERKRAYARNYYQRHKGDRHDGA